MQRFDKLTNAEINEMAAIAESYDMSPERLQEIAKKPAQFEPNATLDDAERGFVETGRRFGQVFHFGESRTGARR